MVLSVQQERLHYEALSQHLGKLGEDAGKMVHRVIDLTRPEDLEGEFKAQEFKPVTFNSDGGGHLLTIKTECSSLSLQVFTQHKYLVCASGSAAEGHFSS